MSLSLSRLHVGKDLLFREKYGVLEPDFMSQMELRFLFISVHSVKLLNLFSCLTKQVMWRKGTSF